MESKLQNVQTEYWDQEVSYLVSIQEQNNFHTQRVLKKFLSLVRQHPCKNVLDIGAGIGSLSLPLLREGSSVTGLDVSAKSLGAYHERARREQLEKSLTLLCQRAEDLESEEAFDMVVTRHVLHHVDDISEVARRIHRSLKQDGVAIFLEPNPLCFYWYPYLTFHPHRSWKVEMGIFDCFPWMLVNRFRDAGFRDIQVLHYGGFPPFVVNAVNSAVVLEDLFPRIPLLKHFLALTFLKVTK